jgi:ABC-2 type transport system permease protein
VNADPARRPRAWPAYVAAARVAARQAWAHRAEVIARAAFYAGIVLIFSRLWVVVAASGAAAAADPKALLWYLAVTEWVLISIPPIHEDVERDVRTGDLAYVLPRPRPYLAMKVAESFGTLLVRLGTLGAVGFPLAWALAGGLPDDPRGLLLALVLGPVAGAMGVLFQASIGVLAVWLQDVSPVYWIWQKAAFLLGGLILPLSLYPDGLATAAAWSPFAALLYAPGRLALGLDAAAAASAAGLLVGWTVVAVVLVRWLYGRALRVLDVNGG